MRVLFAALSLVIAGIALHLAIDPLPDTIAYPDGYRRWTHVKSAIVGGDAPVRPAIDGWHHIYANEAAMQGYATGRFPDGAVIVFDRLTAVRTTTGITEGDRIVVDVMRRASGRSAGTHGWAFEEFRGNARTPTLTDPTRRCAQCHTARAPNGLVISAWRP